MCDFAHLYQRSSKICFRELHGFLVDSEIGLMGGFQIIRTSKLERQSSNVIQETILSRRDVKTKKGYHAGAQNFTLRVGQPLQQTPLNTATTGSVCLSLLMSCVIGSREVHQELDRSHRVTRTCKWAVTSCRAPQQDDRSLWTSLCSFDRLESYLIIGHCKQVIKTLLGVPLLHIPPNQVFSISPKSAVNQVGRIQRRSLSRLCGGLSNFV